MTEEMARLDGIAAALGALNREQPLNAIAYAVISMARDLRTIREDVRDLRRQGAKR